MSNEFLDQINKKSRGKRPQFLGTKAEEHLMSMTMALMQELAVTRERLDTVERLLDQQNVVMRTDINNYTPDDTAAEARMHAQHMLIKTVMRSMEQEIDTMRADASGAAKHPSGESDSPSTKVA